MSLLLDESPLVIQPQLAEALGLNESIVVQQLHYWIQRSKNVYEGKQWVYNSYADWQKQFKFWSERTVIRIFQSLEKKKIVESKQLDEKNGNQTKYYTINYQVLDEMTHDKVASYPCQSVMGTHDKVASCNSITLLPTENTTKTTTNKKNKTSFPQDDKSLQEHAIKRAVQSNLNSPIQTYESFKDHHRANGSKFVNWESAFNTWVRNFFKYKTPNVSETLCLQDANNITGVYNSQLEEFKQDNSNIKFKIEKSLFIQKVLSKDIVAVGIVHG